jgi:uncharacterized membrane protein HdeD (DUF308 family)
MKEGTPWIWVVLSVAITLLLGLVILAHCPVSSLHILGLFLGIEPVIAGAGWIAVGLSLGRHAQSNYGVTGSEARRPTV